MRRLLDLLLLPLHAASVLTGAKSFRNPVIGSPALNARGLHVWRTRLAARLAARRRARLAHRVEPADRDAFARDGFVVKRDFLPPALFARLRAEVAALPPAAREMTEGEAVTRRIALSPSVLAANPALAALLDDAAFRGLVRYVASVDAEPWLAVQTVLSRARPGEADPQTALHMDTFHPNMKAWFYLQDVAEADGPLTFVPGSHRLTRRRLAWQRAESRRAAARRSGGAFRIAPALLPRLGLPPPVLLAVPANTLIVADTFGFHARGRSARPSVRVEIYAIGRPSPFRPFAMAPLERLVPWLGRRKVALQWVAQDVLAPLGLMRPTWRPARRGAFDPAPGG